ncbi:GNAT family protein [Dyella sp. M7H15-1]|uniref:GNAT family N-acetyltransferase n=1 Tax=Dyella sp. M7H15-1 TaxID=2501295 RepID=UPI0013E8B4A7|nr:GNAT family protein [Dyella sp. M7H15-1]
MIGGTERLEWNALCDADFESYYTLYADPRVALPTGLQPLGERGAARKWFEQTRDLPAEQGRILALRPQGKRTLIGVLRLTEWDHLAQHVTLGYALTPACWGQGFMYECLAAVLPDVFAGAMTEPVRRVQAWVLVDNRRSSGLLQKLGFRHEGTLRELFHHEGRHCDVQCYGLLRSDNARLRAIAAPRVDELQTALAC